MEDLRKSHLDLYKRDGYVKVEFAYRVKYYSFVQIINFGS